jgi:putative hydrolase of the HAD superfamily
LKTTISDLFFDLDHTLWDFEKNSAMAFETVFRKHQIELALADFHLHYSAINTAYWKLYREEKVTQQQLRYGRLKDTFDLLKYVISDDLIHQISIDYIAVLPDNNYLFDGTIAILDYLKPKYNLHIITNGFEEVQNHKLKNSGIQPYFQTITNSENAGAKKPNPIIFDCALQVANANKAQSMMIGDCLEADVQGALSFGMDAIFFNPLQQEAPTSIKQISHLLELKNYL